MAVQNFNLSKVKDSVKEKVGNIHAKSIGSPVSDYKQKKSFMSEAMTSSSIGMKKMAGTSMSMAMNYAEKSVMQTSPETYRSFNDLRKMKSTAGAVAGLGVGLALAVPGAAIGAQRAIMQKDTYVHNYQAMRIKTDSLGPDKLSSADFKEMSRITAANESKKFLAKYNCTDPAQLSAVNREKYNMETKATVYKINGRTLVNDTRNLQSSTRSFLAENNINVSKMNKNDLNNLINKLSRDPKNADTVTALKTELHLRNSKGNIRGNGVGARRVRRNTSRLVKAAYNEVLYQPGMEGLVALRVDTKSLVSIGKNLGKFYKITLYDGGVRTAAKVSSTLLRSKYGGQNAAVRALDIVGSGRVRNTIGSAVGGKVSAVGHAAALNAKAGAKIAGRAIGRKTGASKVAANVGAKVRYAKVGIFNRGRSLAARMSRLPGAKFIRGAGLKIGGAFKKIAGIGGAFLNGTFNILDLMKGMIKAVAGALGGFILMVSSAIVIILLIICLITFIFEAVGSKTKKETFYQTYDALKELDEEFSEQLVNIYTIDKLRPKPEYTEHRIKEYTSENVYYLNGDGENAYSSQTIKGIISMATVYIEQDFKKYGLSYPGAVFGASCTYKQYALDLYRAGHMIGTFPTDIYYCAAGENAEGEEHHVAEEGCNNMIKGGGNKDAWLNSGTGPDRNFTVSLKSEPGFYYTKETYENDNGDTSTKTVMHPQTIYEILENGPHGSEYYTTETGGGEDNISSVKEAEQAMEAKGCHNYERRLLYRNKDGGEISTYALICKDPECRGHVDSNVIVFVSNVYDPSLYPSEKGDSYATADEESREFKYSLYALDRYATLERCNSETTTDGAEQYANPTEEEKALPDEYAAQTKILKEIANNATVDFASGNIDELEAINWTELTKSSLGNFVKDLSTETSKFRLINESETGQVIDQLDTGNSNPVTEENSEQYRFESYTTLGSGHKTNDKFTGWNKGNIELVRLLMAGDWEELYGITDFGGVTGAPMTEAQIAALISNNPNWKDLSPDRQAVLATAVAFYNQIKRLGVNYHGGQCTAGSIDDLELAASKRDAFTIGDIGQHICISKWWNSKHCKTDPGIDCSGYVSWILYASVGFPSSKVSTSGMAGYVGSELIPVNPADLLPGDIALKPGSHVRMYLGGGKWTEAAGHNEGVLWDHFLTESSFNGYSFYKSARIDDTVKPTTNNTEEEENLEE